MRPRPAGGCARSPPAGSPPWWTSVVDYTAQVQAAFFSWLGRDAPRPVPVVFAILAGGAPFQLERLHARGGRFAGAENVYLDTASYGRRALEHVVASVGEAALVYGSDTPVIDARPTLDAVRSLGDRIAGGVLGKNASRLLP